MLVALKLLGMQLSSTAAAAHKQTCTHTRAALMGNDTLYITEASGLVTEQHWQWEQVEKSTKKQEVVSQHHGIVTGLHIHTTSPAIQSYP